MEWGRFGYCLDQQRTCPLHRRPLTTLWPCAGKGAPPSPWGAGSSGRRGQGQLSHLRRLSLGGGPDSPQAAAAAAGGSPVGAAAVQPHCGGGPVPQRRLLPPGSSPPVRPLRLHDNPLAAQQGGQRRPAAAAAPGVVA